VYSREVDMGKAFVRRNAIHDGYRGSRTSVASGQRRFIGRRPSHCDPARGAEDHSSSSGSGRPSRARVDRHDGHKDLLSACGIGVQANQPHDLLDVLGEPAAALAELADVRIACPSEIHDDGQSNLHRRYHLLARQVRAMTTVYSGSSWR
jgi:hypothetical protein